MPSRARVVTASSEPAVSRLQGQERFGGITIRLTLKQGFSAPVMGVRRPWKPHRWARLTAWVIGEGKIYFRAWADTVDASSRMASHGTRGRIQVTAPVSRGPYSTIGILRDRAPLTSKGAADGEFGL